MNWRISGTSGSMVISITVGNWLGEEFAWRVRGVNRWGVKEDTATTYPPRLRV